MQLITHNIQSGKEKTKLSVWGVTIISFLFFFLRVRVEIISNEALSCNWKIPTAERLALSAIGLTKISLH